MIQGPGPTVPPKTDLSIDMQEFPQLAEAALAFMQLNGMLLGSAAPAQFDASLTALQRMRPLLERWAGISARLKVISPIATLDELAKKRFFTLGSRLTAAHQCASSACLLQQTLAIVLQVLHKLGPQAVKVDPAQLKKMN